MLCENHVEDNDFCAELAYAYDIPASFSVLAQSLSPPRLEPDLAKRTEAWLTEHAKAVWPESKAELQLIGSTYFGTDIVKGGGKRSDRDYCLRLDTGPVTDGEWRLLFERLRSDGHFADVEQGSKAIRMIDKALGIPFEVVPVEGAFTYDLIPHPSLHNTWSRIARNEDLLSFYNTYGQGSTQPGARNCTRALKRFLPVFKGHVLESLVFFQGKQMLQHAPEVASSDTSGHELFKRLLQLFYLYPEGDRSGPLKTLLRDCRQLDSDDKQMHRKLLVAKYVVADFYQAALPDLKESSKSCCLPMECVQALMGAAGVLAGIMMSLLFQLSFKHALSDFRFWQEPCSSDSCLCNDCNQASWLHWVAHGEGPTCRAFTQTLDRCLIRLATRVARCFAFGAVLIASSSGRRQRSASSRHSTEGMLRDSVAVASALLLLSCLSDLPRIGPNPAVSCLLQNFAACCSAASSMLIVFYGVQANGLVGRIWSQGEILCWSLIKWFLYTVIGWLLMMVLWRALVPSSVLDDVDHRVVVFQQYHFFTSACLLINTMLLRLGVWLCVSHEAKRVCCRLFWLHVLWCVFVGGHLWHGVEWPGTFSQLSFSVNLLKTVVVVQRFVLMLRFASAIPHTAVRGCKMV